MDLEKKVQMLEQEIEILKNQIQATLLDIKEQMLTHTYPVLRADAHSSSSVQSANGQPMQSAVTETNEAQVASDNTPVRKVTLSDIGKAPAVSHQPEVSTQQNSPAPALDWRMMQELEAWANNTLVDVGIQRTRELINLYTQNGQFTPAMRDALLQMISIQPSSGATIPSVLASKAPSQSTTQQKKRPANKQQSSKKEPVKQPSTAPRREVSKRTTPQPNNRPSSKAVEEDESVEKNNVVLRLIAGIQNAGVGVKWKRKDG